MAFTVFGYNHDDVFVFSLYFHDSKSLENPNGELIFLTTCSDASESPVSEV